MSRWITRWIIGLSLLGAGGGLFPQSAAGAEVEWVRVGTSGKSIIVLFKDAGGPAKAYVKTIVAPPKITINGTETLTLDEPIYQQVKGDSAGLPYIIYPLFKNVLKATDQVTISAPANWVACNGGPIDALNNLPVENYVGKSLLPPPTPRHTMPIGFNLSCQGWGDVIFRANLARAPGAYVSWETMKAADIPLGPNGLPTSVANKPLLILGYPQDTPGDFTLLWDGKDQLELTNTWLKLKEEHLTGGADNRRVYTTGPQLSKNRQGVYVKFLGPDVHNLRVYPPGVKTDGAQYFHPEFLRMLRGASSIRFIHELYVCDTNLSTFEELRQDRQEIQISDIALEAKILKSEPCENPSSYFISGGDGKPPLCCKFTTAEPHHLKTGYKLTIWFNRPPSFADGSSLPEDDKRMYGYAYVLSPTEFVISSPKPMKAQDLDAKVLVRIQRGDMWLSEMVDLVNTLDGCNMWLCIPNLMEDDAVAKMFELIGRRLAKGRKVRVEYSNEVWNWQYTGTFYAWSMALSDKDPLINKPFKFQRWYTKRAGQIQKIARQTFAKLGRDEHDIITVLCGQFGADSYLDYAKDAHLSFDEFGVAPYFEVGPNSACYSENSASTAAAFLNAITKKVDIDQACDMADMYIQHANVAATMLATAALSLKKAGGPTKLVAYEGGPESCFFGGQDLKQQQTCSVGWSRHPRMAEWMRYYLQRIQDEFGVEHFEAFTINHGYGGKGRMLHGIYSRWDQPDGKGDGSDGLFNNLSDLFSPKCVSVIGYGYHNWIDQVAKDRAGKP